MQVIVPDDYDRAYQESPHLARLAGRGEVRVFSDPPADEAALIA